MKNITWILCSNGSKINIEYDEFGNKILEKINDAPLAYYRYLEPYNSLVNLYSFVSNNETPKGVEYDSKGKIKIPDSIPNIEYDFRELKNGIAKVSEGEQKSKQIEMYKQAKQTQDTFRSSKGKVDILMGIVDKAYFTVQAFLQNRNKNQVKALNPGKMEARRSIRDELKNREYTEKTNEVSREYKEALEQKEMAVPVVDKESGEQEIDEMINL